LVYCRQFIALAGLWFGSSKPRIDTFLKCFVDECRNIYNGISKGKLFTCLFLAAPGTQVMEGLHMGVRGWEIHITM